MLKAIWVGMLILGLILLILAVILSICWRVVSIVNELSGKTAKRQIELLKNIKVSTTVNPVIVDTEEGSSTNITDVQDLKPYIEDKTGIISEEDYSSIDRTNIMDESEVVTMVKEDDTNLLDESYLPKNKREVILINEISSLNK